MNVSVKLPQAFILTGAFWVICRNPLYLTELSQRGMAILVITPEKYREQAEVVRTDLNSPIALIADVAYVGGSVDKESSFNASVIAAAQKWQQHYQIVGAFAVGETLVEPTGLLADALGLFSPGLRATRVCRSKYLQRFYLSAFSPRSCTVPPEERVRLIPDEMSYPVIIKPATRHSSSGVVSVDDARQAADVLATYPDYETLLIEQKIVGQEYSVETLTQNGKPLFSSVTRKVTTDTHDNTFVELSHTVPCRDASKDILLHATQQVLTALHFRDGISHAEWRLTTDNTPYLMEIAARTPGDGLLALYQLACGQPLEPVIMSIALGEQVSFPEPTRIARQVYLEHTPGILKDVQLHWEGITPQWISDSDIWPTIYSGTANEGPTLRAVFVQKQRGERLSPLRSSDDRAVTFFIDATTTEALDILEAQVIARITLDIEADHEQ